MKMFGPDELRTYFAVVDESYLKIGSSVDPFHRNWSQSKLPTGLDLSRSSKRFLGSARVAECAEVSMHRQFRPWLIDGCREWYQWCPETKMMAESIRLDPVEWIPQQKRIDLHKKHVALLYGWKYARFIVRFAHVFIEQCESQIREHGGSALSAGEQRQIINRVADSHGLMYRDGGTLPITSRTSVAGLPVESPQL